MYAQRPTPNAIYRKRNVAAVLAALVFTSSLIQAQGPGDFIPIDYKGEAPSSQAAYLQNRGQLTAMQGGLAPDILYYSIQSFPQMFFSNKNEVFFQLGARDSSLTTPDQIYRVGMKMIGPNVNLECVPNTYEEQPDYWNFILGHLEEPIMGLHASRRIVYPDVYPFIDFHAYSNPWGPKFYFVMRAGSDPADLRLQFSGQDSLILDAYDQLKAYAGGLSVVLPKGLSYQQINGGTVLVDAEVDYELFPGEISVGFTPGTYNPAYPLIIDVSASFGAMGGGSDMEPEWGTFYGHTETDFPTDARLLTDGSLLVCGRTLSPSFPLLNAQDGNFDGSAEGYFSEFDPLYARVYTTLFGGNAFDSASSLDVTTDESSVYMTGRTLSNDLPLLELAGGFYDDTPEPYPHGDSYFLKFNRVNFPLGQRELVTYFGQGISTLNRLRVSPDGHVHVIGTTAPFSPATVPELTCQGTTGTFPICNPPGSADFTQANIVGAPDAFYLHFNSEFALVHSTFFGGEGSEHGNDLVLDPVTGDIYFCGSTASRRLAPVNCQPTGTSGGFPLCDMPGAYFQQNLNNGNTTGVNDGYMARLSSAGELLWSTYVGSTSDETGYFMGRNLDGSVYMTGLTNAPDYSTANCAPPTGGGLPNCASGNQIHYPRSTADYDNYIVRFDGPSKALAWSTFIQADVRSFAPDEGANMVIGMTAGPGLPTLPRPNTYFQPACVDPSTSEGTDALVIGVTPNDELLFSTYFGGLGNDAARQALPWSGGRLYLVGSSASTFSFPFHCPPTPDPYCYMSYATQSASTGEAFYSQLQYDVTIGINETDLTTAGNSQVQIFPNPTDGSISMTFGDAWLAERIVELSVYDAAGRTVQEQYLTPGAQPLAVRLQHAPPGAYVLNLRAAERLTARQLILVR